VIDALWQDAQMVRLAAIGLPAGVLLALGAANVFASRLMMVDVFDVIAYGAGIGVVIAACVSASVFPALRAARLNPMSILRAE